MFKLALDAGHGLHTAGKRCLKSIDKNETREWTLNSRICSRLQEKLKEYDGIETKRMDDVSGQTDISLAERCKNANEWGANFYLSIHHNAGINGGSGGGLVVYRYNKLSESGETAKWQKTFYEKLVAAGVPKGNRATPLGTATFTVLADTKMKSVLIECGFMDSTVDTPLILTEAFADKVVDGCINALVILTGIKKKAVAQAPSVSEPEEPKKENTEMSNKTDTVPGSEIKTEETPQTAVTEKEVETAKEPSVENPELSETPSATTVKKTWVEVVKEILKLILDWLKVINMSK